LQQACYLTPRPGETWFFLRHDKKTLRKKLPQQKKNKRKEKEAQARESGLSNATLAGF
jgi:hypothetical protein